MPLGARGAAALSVRRVLRAFKAFKLASAPPVSGGPGAGQRVQDRSLAGHVGAAGSSSTGQRGAACGLVAEDGAGILLAA